MATFKYIGDPALLTSASDGQMFRVRPRDLLTPVVDITYHPGTAFDFSAIGGSDYDVTQIPPGGFLGNILVQSVGE
jgi:hypothetical protein